MSIFDKLFGQRRRIREVWTGVARELGGVHHIPTGWWKRATERIEASVDGIPVVLAGRLVGVVSQRDLLRASLSGLSQHRDAERRAFLAVVEIARVMSTPPIVVAPSATIEQAAAMMASKRIGCLPVLQDDELVGMITETDILRWVARAAG